MIDFKKEYKVLYQAKATASLVDVPELLFIAVDGQGDPNTSLEYEQALQLLYGLSYTIKMSKKWPTVPPAYFDYVVAPLEGLWWGDDSLFSSSTVIDKSKLFWTAMILQPHFVTSELFHQACLVLKKKRNDLDVNKARLMKYNEGLCVQILHLGSYDDEPQSISSMEAFALTGGYEIDINDKRLHHEIYLSDPRKVTADKLKTIIRHPIRIRQN